MEKSRESPRQEGAGGEGVEISEVTKMRGGFRTHVLVYSVKCLYFQRTGRS